MYFNEMNGAGKPSVEICDGSKQYIDWTMIQKIKFQEEGVVKCCYFRHKYMHN